MMPMPLLTQNQSKPRSFIRQSSQPDLRSKNDSKKKKLIDINGLAGGNGVCSTISIHAGYGGFF